MFCSGNTVCLGVRFRKFLFSKIWATIFVSLLPVWHHTYTYILILNHVHSYLTLDFKLSLSHVLYLSLFFYCFLFSTLNPNQMASPTPLGFLNYFYPTQYDESVNPHTSKEVVPVSSYSVSMSYVQKLIRNVVHDQELWDVRRLNCKLSKLKHRLSQLEISLSNHIQKSLTKILK